MSQLNGVPKIIFAVINKGALAMILNEKLNDTYHKMLQEKPAHTCERVRNNTETTGACLKNSMEKTQYHWFVLRVQTYCVRHKGGNIKIQTKEKTHKQIVVGYSENHKRDTYKLNNP